MGEPPADFKEKAALRLPLGLGLRDFELLIRGFRHCRQKDEARGAQGAAGGKAGESNPGMEEAQSGTRAGRPCYEAQG